MKQPTISVIIPTYNRAHCLSRALDSVFNQSFSCFECHVIDDASTDNTLELLSSYPNISVTALSQQMGVSAARNMGISQAKGEWLAFLDSDDEWLPAKLSRQVALINASPEARWVHTNETWVRLGVRVNPMKKHEKRGGWIYKYCLPRCVVSPSSVLIHRSVFESIGLFDEQLPACEDYDLWLRIAAHYPVLFEEASCLVKYGGHADQLSYQYWGMDRFRILALMKQLDSGSLPEDCVVATRAMLMQKLSILIMGATKRQQHEQVKCYEQQREKYRE
ncbi:MAG: glycosyl transferase [Legionellales bacterium]|nr:glycosyl transferase [Legionellales bacterium]|tara:strand:- start:2103 stop:2933 length:831 start_codon:yes stop_codon:yes gene_type:complete